MKHTHTQIMMAGLLLIAVTSISCKKEYTCKCSKTYTSGTGTSTNDYSVYTYKDNRARAETRCNENTKSGTDILATTVSTARFNSFF